MATHDEIEEKLARTRLLPVLVLDDAATASRLGAALLAGGAELAEVTFRTAAAEDALRAMAEVAGVCAGAGTVLTTEQVDRAAAAGARFVVSPGLDSDVVLRCRELGLPVFPGVATPSEVMAALRLGVRTLKLFPAATLGGPAAVAALAAPFPGTRFVPTGGIDASSAADYLRHPAVLAVGGSWMAPAALVRAGDWSRITDLTAAAVAAAQTVEVSR